tara:strand:+ start:4098 stop:4316 length:219 start_codon:yes stop_codon:yes gene_type:complete
MENLNKNAGFIVNQKGYFFHSILIVRVLEKIAELFLKYDNSKKNSRLFTKKFANILILKNLLGLICLVYHFI